MIAIGQAESDDYQRPGVPAQLISVVPPAEPEAGHTVAMLLINENTMNLRSGADAASAAQAPVQVWLRCAPPVSALEPPPRRPARSADS